MDIVGEGMGIGSPLGLRNGRAVFALDSDDAYGENRAMRTFLLNGMSVKKMGRIPVGAPYRIVRRLLAPMYVKDRAFRILYQYLMYARSALGLKSDYARTVDMGKVRVDYKFDVQRIDVNVLSEGLDGGQLLIANELSGRLFRSLVIDGERLDKIPPWVKVNGTEAILVSPRLRLGMVVRQIDGCGLFAGREVVGNRLDWAGFSYVLHPEVKNIRYEVRFQIIG